MSIVPSLLSEWTVADLPKQLRVRLEPETLRLVSELQALMRDQDKPCSLEAIISLAISELHADLL